MTSYRRPNGRDVLSWGATAALDVRHLTYEQWRFLDRVGLRGLLPDGTADPSFGPRTRCATAPPAICPSRRDGTAKEVELEAIAKFGLPRTVEIQDATVREIDWYRRTERAATVRKASRNLWRRSPNRPSDCRRRRTMTASWSSGWQTRASASRSTPETGAGLFAAR
ncbi:MULTISPECIES: hypothetical protein [unclassified Streptomyces]|uniref:hypothetical protein n=1 Tax=unclassified Streptomyces TaxID=2593676 RepID=UPI0036A86693